MLFPMPCQCETLHFASFTFVSNINALNARHQGMLDACRGGYGNHQSSGGFRQRHLGETPARVEVALCDDTDQKTLKTIKSRTRLAEA
jgi:hypothetical protein